MTATSKQELAAMPVEFKLNGRDVTAYGNETIIQAAKRHGVRSPASSGAATRCRITKTGVRRAARSRSWPPIRR